MSPSQPKNFDAASPQNDINKVQLSDLENPCGPVCLSLISRTQEHPISLSERQPKRKRLWLNDGSCIRLRPQYKDHVWSGIALVPTSKRTMNFMACVIGFGLGYVVYLTVKRYQKIT
ncbi:MAG: hypothetical protein MI725_06075 [Pirellulales bacterium]|nr:hypothetical protein [Pirellulales bacterium]